MFNRFQFNRQGNMTLGDLVEMGYPIFDDSWYTEIPEHKATLMGKIIKEYYFYEIGQETPDKFKWTINAHLARIMPYYNQLYKSELIKFDPMLNYALKTSERTLENLVSLANNSNSAMAKAVRNFANQGLENDINNVNEEGTKNNVIDKTGNMVYTKNGDETTSEVENVNKTTEEKDNLERNINETTTFDTNVNETGNTRLGGTDTEEVNNNETTNSTRTPNLTEKTDSTKGVVETGSSEASGTTSKTTDTEGSGEETNNLKETTNTSTKQDYSDTPQKKLPDEVRKDYLTNVTWTDTDTTHNADTTKNNSYSENKTEKGESSDNTSTTNNSDTTVAETRVSSGTETEDGNKNLTGTTNTNYGKTSDEVKDTKKTGTEATTTNQIDEATKDVEEHTGRDLNKNKDWKESGDQKDVDNTVENNTFKTTTASTGQLQTNSSGVDNSSNFTTAAQAKDEKSTRDTGGTKDQTGYFNVSASSLLEAFRKTFLNIDDKIVKELYDDFMTVF